MFEQPTILLSHITCDLSICDSDAFWDQILIQFCIDRKKLIGFAECRIFSVIYTMDGERMIEGGGVGGVCLSSFSQPKTWKDGV